MNEAHPDTLIGRRPCTCSWEGSAAWRHEPFCEIAQAHLAAMARLPRMAGNPEAHGADE